MQLWWKYKSKGELVQLQWFRDRTRKSRKFANFILTAIYIQIFQSCLLWCRNLKVEVDVVHPNQMIKRIQSFSF